MIFKLKKLVFLFILFFPQFIIESIHACDREAMANDRMMMNPNYQEDNYWASQYMTEFFAIFYAKCLDVKFYKDTVNVDLSVVDSDICTQEFNLTHLITFHTNENSSFYKFWFMFTEKHRSQFLYHDLEGIKSWMMKNKRSPENLSQYPYPCQNFPINKLLTNKPIFKTWEYVAELERFMPVAELGTNINIHIVKDYQTNETILFGNHIISF